ncbi:MAG: efflux RND transporter permease subunit, partial [Candidatus Pacebacteria bacterium]|nr:efflux RND transporter permease subunit [Candidatus Paceibacterota bacterium]
MTKFWTFFIDRHHFTILLTIVLILAGFTAVLAIPKESSPEIQVPLGIVTTVLPGASAEDIEQLITDKVEDRVLSLERVSKVTSSSGAGVSSVSVEFEANADIDRSIQLLKDEIDKVRPELPEEAEDPIVSDVNFADQPIIIASIAGNLAPGELTALGETVKDELERVPGVSSVSLSGVRERQVQVIVRQEKLLQYGLSLSDVTGALRLSGAASPAGTITIDHVKYSVRFEAGLESTEEVGNVAIAGPGGNAIHIRDVADVVDSVADPVTFSRVSLESAPSSPALTLSVFKSRGGNILQTGTEVKETLAELSKTTLAGTETVITFDAADDISHDLTELSRVGLETVFLVMLMLFATLGWRESLAAALSIPLSFLIAFIGIYASGNTINFISLFALILAIGILVDSGIVIVEAIHTRLGKLGDKRAAALAAIKEYAWPLIAGTFTTVVVFVPLFFLSGIVGKFVASIPFTLIFVLLASIFVALGLVPLFTMYIIKPERSKIELIQERYNEKAQHWYKSFLRSVLGNRKKENRFLQGMLALFVISLMLPIAGLVKVEFFPAEDMDLAIIEIETPPGTPLAETDLVVREVEEYLYGDERIESFVTETGAGSSFTSGFASGGGNENIANVTLNLQSERKDTSAEIVADYREKLAEITSGRVTVSELEGGPPSGAPLLVTFSGDDLGNLTLAADRAARMLSDIPGAINVTASTRGDVPEFVVRLDSAKAVELGVSPASVGATLRGALFGSEATTIRTGSEDIEIRTKLNLNPTYTDPSEATRASIDAVRGLSIQGTKGPVPLSSIATVSFEPAVTIIQHEAGERIAQVSGEVAAGGNAVEITSQFTNALAAQELPAGVTLNVGGESEDVNQSFAEMGLALLAGLAFMLAILVLEFNSFRHSFYLLAIIPLSLIGVFFGLMITRQALSFTSMLGVIALAGVIINHAIILMDSISRIGRENPNQTLIDVVVEAAASRFRPIVLTTIVTVVGMIPLSFASALWGPLAFAIMFGLTFSMALTLLLIPVLYHR